MIINPTSLGPRAFPASALQRNVSYATYLSTELQQTALPLSMVPDEKLVGVLYASGHTRMRHVCKSVTYPTGLLAPDGFLERDGYGTPGVTSKGRVSHVDFVLNGANFNYTTKYLTLQRRWGSGGGIGGTVNEYGTWFEFQIVTALGAANQYWQIVRQGDPVDTLQAMVDALNADPGTVGVTWAAPLITHVNYTGPAYDPAALPGTTAHPFLEAEIRDVDTIRFKWRFTGPVSDYTRLRQNCTLGGDPSPDNTGTEWKPVVKGAFPTEGPDGTSAYIEFTGDLVGATLNRTFATADTSGGTGTWHWWVTLKSAVVGGGLQLEALKAVARTGAGGPGTYTDTDFDALCHAQDYFNGVSPTWRGYAVAFYAAPAAPGPGFNYYGYTDWELQVTGATSGGVGVQGFIRWNKNSVRTNNSFFVQDYWNGAAPPPVPGYNVWTQLTGGSNPIGVVNGVLSTPGKGVYRIAPSWFREKDNARSGFGDYYQLDHPGGGIILDAGFPAAEDPGVDYLRLWRTLLDRPGDYFRVADVPIAETEYEDDKGDGEIAGVLGSLMYNPREYRSRANGYPPGYRHLAKHLGSVFGAGISRWKDVSATADFVKGSDVVDFTAPANPSRRWVNRYLQREGETEKYKIVKVDPQTREVWIGKPYEGDDATDANVTVRDERRATKVGRSEPGFLNQWPAAREWHGIDSLDELGVTALASNDQSLFLWTRDSTWILHGNSPTTFALDPILDGIGCCCHRGLVMHNGTAYWLEGPEGFYRWNFQGPPIRISNPSPVEIQSAEPWGIQRTIERINWDAIDWAWGIADPDGQAIRWFLPVDGCDYPNLQLIFDIKSEVWRTESCDGFTAGCQYTRKDGTVGLLVGDLFGQIWQLGIGDSDGVFDHEPKHTIDAGSTVKRILVTGASLPTEQLGAIPFLVLHADGTTERGVAHKNDPTFLDTMIDLEQAPEAGDILILGGIDTEVMPNRFHQGAPELRKSCPILWVQAAPGEGEYYLDVAVDDHGLEPPVFDTNVGSLASENGVERFRINQIGYQHTFRIRTFMPGTQLTLRRFELQTQYLDVMKVPR